MPSRCCCRFTRGKDPRLSPMYLTPVSKSSVIIHSPSFRLMVYQVNKQAHPRVFARSLDKALFSQHKRAPISPFSYHNHFPSFSHCSCRLLLPQLQLHCSTPSTTIHDHLRHPGLENRRINKDKAHKNGGTFFEFFEGRYCSPDV